GVKEYYFTGGEPFLNPEMTAILEVALNYGPASVLTNASVLKDDWLKRLHAAEESSRYSLEWRVSLDGYSPESNDPIRGHGTFARTMAGVQRLVEFGFLPVITVAQMDDDAERGKIFHNFVAALRAVGYMRPRLKVLPALRLGAEVERGRGYADNERVTREMMAGFEVSSLLCSHARLVSDHGVHTCPILLEAPDALLAPTLRGALRPYALRHHACYTCYHYGSICANPSEGAHDA